jgi:hypothetical protein
MIIVINRSFGQNAKKTFLGNRPSTGGRVLRAHLYLHRPGKVFGSTKTLPYEEVISEIASL